MEAAAECILTNLRVKCRIPWKLGKKQDNMKIPSLLNKKNLTNANARKLQESQKAFTNIYQKEQQE